MPHGGLNAFSQKRTVLTADLGREWPMALLSLQELLQLGKRQRIDHVIGFELAAAGLVDPEPDIGKSASQMGIRRDRDFDAC